MEVRINREIRNYTETIYFGMNVRETVWNSLAVVTAVSLYFMLDFLSGTELHSWACILGAAPFVGMAFIKYNGMTAQKAARAWIRSQILSHRKLKFRAENICWDHMKSILRKNKKEAMRNHD